MNGTPLLPSIVAGASALALVAWVIWAVLPSKAERTRKRYNRHRSTNDSRDATARFFRNVRN